MCLEVAGSSHVLLTGHLLAIAGTAMRLLLADVTDYMRRNLLDSSPMPCDAAMKDLTSEAHCETDRTSLQARYLP